MTMTREYLVHHGAAGHVGRFRAAGDGCARGDAVVIRSQRGLELGEVLAPADDGRVPFPDGFVGVFVAFLVVWRSATALMLALLTYACGSDWKMPSSSVRSSSQTRSTRSAGCTIDEILPLKTHPLRAPLGRLAGQV